MNYYLVTVRYAIERQGKISSLLVQAEDIGRVHNKIATYAEGSPHEIIKITKLIVDATI